MMRAIKNRLINKANRHGQEKGVNMTISRRNLFKWGALIGSAALLSACSGGAARYRVDDSIATPTRSAEGFRMAVEQRKAVLINTYTALREAGDRGSLGQRDFNDYASLDAFADFDTHIQNPNLPEYLDSIMAGYNRNASLLYSNNHLEAQSLAEAAATYLRDENKRVRAKAAVDLAAAFARAYKDIFGNGLQQAIADGTYNPQTVIEVCGNRKAPDGLAWAYQTIINYRPLVQRAFPGLLESCAISCTNGRVMHVGGSR